VSDHPYTRSEQQLTYAITQAALDNCAAAAAAQIAGVTIAEHRFKRPRGRAAVVSVDDDAISAHLRIGCRQGVVLPDCARTVQTAVADALGRLTALPVRHVDVDVVAITRP
jgi:uncharacterized alkaline shock family protein YloU